jgi:outer membrane biosynthesis protein TonB
VEPELTAAIRRSYDHGSALARVRVGTGGEVRSVEIVKASPAEFGTVTRDAVLQWRYSPALCDGTPAEAIVRVSSSFRVHR